MRLRRYLIALMSLCIFALAVVLGQQRPVPLPPDVALSPGEQRELDNIRLKRQNLQLQIQIWQQQLTAATQDIAAQHDRLERDALAAHKLDPARYVLDEDRGGLVVKSGAPASATTPPAPPAEKK